MNINQERLAECFITLCEIDSPSKKEGKVSAFLKKLFQDDLGASEIIEDDSSSTTGSDCGNLIVRFSGELDTNPVFFNCHMDTVEPAANIKVRREGPLFSSLGDTVLGGDDKSGIAILIEVMRVLRDSRTPHCPVEFVFTTCEEIGLLGAKALDPKLVRAKSGFALDTSGVDCAIIGAPASNKILVKIHGVAAHAGLHPETGINAIQLAAKSIARLKLGRIDDESTANIGLISGGTATNIVPEFVTIEGEVRSHNTEKLSRFTNEIEQIFQHDISTWPDPSGQAKGKPSLFFEAKQEYPVMRLSRETHEVVRRVEHAANALSREIDLVVAGGGSDANIFNAYGMETIILGTGMQHVHSTDERIDLRDMTRTAELVISVLTS